MKQDPFLSIPRRNICCARGEESLRKEHLHYSLLEWQQEKQWVRHDFCVRCWEVISIPNAYPNCIAYWQVTKSSKPNLPESEHPLIETALAWLRNHYSDSSQRQQAKCFLVALFLERKKRLFLRNDRGEKWVFEEPREQEIFLLQRLHFPSSEMALLQKEVIKEIQQICFTAQ